MNQVMLSGYVKSIDFITTRSKMETRIYLEVNNFDKTNMQILPIKIEDKLAPISYYEINVNDYIYVHGELMFFQENGSNKMFVLSQYYEIKNNILSDNSKLKVKEKFIDDYSPEKLSTHIKMAMEKKNKSINEKDAIRQAYKKKIDKQKESK